MFDDMLNEDDYRPLLIFRRALEHFAKRFELLKTDDDIKFAMDAITNDLDANAANCRNLAIRIKDGKERYENIVQYNLGLICNALIAYSSDLQANKKLIFDKLFSGAQNAAGIEMEYFDMELKFVDRVKNYYCKMRDAE